MAWERVDVATPDYAFTDSPEPHAVRRRAILANHPEIHEFFGYDRWSVVIMLGAVAGQLVLGGVVAGLDWSRPLSSGAIALVLAVFVGAVLSHWSSMFIHEATHDNCGATPGENRVWGLVANANQVLPTAMTFRKYHLRHHAHLGVLGIDADLPADWEVNGLPRNRVTKGLWLFFMLAFWVARGWERQTPPNRFEVINLVYMVGVNLALYWVIGPIGLAWLLLCTLIGHSFHPVAAHFIHEHYVFEEGQETFSYYGLLNLVTYNVGYHVEHHDFPRVPGRLLPALRRRIPQYYEGLVSHRSWTWVQLDFVFSSRMGWHRRIARGDRRGGSWSQPETLSDPSLLSAKNGAPGLPDRP